MQAAIRNTQFEFPKERVLISLSPADLKKEGAGFDLPIALCVLFAQGKADGMTDFIDEQVLIMGELELSGKIRAVKGINAAVSTAVSNGIKYCIVPGLNFDEAVEVRGAKIYGADSLENAFYALKDSPVNAIGKYHYSEFNSLERILLDIFTNIEYTISRYRRCGNFNCGG